MSGVNVPVDPRIFIPKESRSHHGIVISASYRYIMNLYESTISIRNIRGGEIKPTSSYLKAINKISQVKTPITFTCTVSYCKYQLCGFLRVCYALPIPIAFKDFGISGQVYSIPSNYRSFFYNRGMRVQLSIGKNFSSFVFSINTTAIKLRNKSVITVTLFCCIGHISLLIHSRNPHLLPIRIHQLHWVIRAIRVRRQRRIFVTHRVHAQPDAQIGAVIP